MKITEMLDALQLRVDALLQANRQLAARLAHEVTGPTDPVPAEAEDDMKRKKPAEDPPPHGLLFGELGEEAEVTAEDVQEELNLGESDNINPDVDPAPGRKRRAASAGTRRAAAKPQPIVAEPPTPARSEATPPAQEPALNEIVPAASEATPTPTKAARPAEPTPVPTISTPALAEDTPALPQATPALTKAAPAATEATPVPTEATPGLTEATPATPEPTPALTKAAPGAPEATPVPTEAAPAAAEDVPSWVSSDTFDEESVAQADEIIAVVAVAEVAESRPALSEAASQPGRMPHPFAFAGALPVPRAQPVPPPRLRPEPRPEGRSRKPHPFAGTAAYTLTVASPANGRRKHPFSDVGSSAVQQSSASPDVHWSFPAEHSENRRTETLRKQMEKAGLSRDEAADSLGVMRSSIDTWLSGSVPVPLWVLSSMRVLELLSPQARRNARTRATRKSPGKEQRHPFAKIEEL